MKSTDLEGIQKLLDKALAIASEEACRGDLALMRLRGKLLVCGLATARLKNKRFPSDPLDPIKETMRQAWKP
jgi:hypothetical protein